MFLGTYKEYFTGKNRILLPKKFRKELKGEDRVYIVKGIDGEIWGFDSDQWFKEAEDRLRIPIAEHEGRILRRKFFSLADECVLDNQGRFTITQELVDYAGIKNEILLIGAGDHFEIWDPKIFKEQEKG